MRKDNIGPGRSNQDYLRTMLDLKETNGYIRSVDVATSLSVSNPSVSYAVKSLMAEGFIEKDKAGFLQLTDKGMREAKKLKRKKEVLEKFLLMIGVDKDVAQDDAHRIEHDISDDSFRALNKYLDRVM